MKAKIGNRIIDTSYIVDARYDPEANVTVFEKRGIRVLALDGNELPDVIEPYLALTYAVPYQGVPWQEELFGEAASIMWTALVHELNGEWVS